VNADARLAPSSKVKSGFQAESRVGDIKNILAAMFGTLFLIGWGGGKRIQSGINLEESKIFVE
jgi:hypothetical protein